MSVHRHRFGSQHPAGAPRVLVIVCALLLASLAAVISTVPTANADTPADPSTTGTASTVSPSTVAVGGTIMFTLSGFPGGVTVQVLIDDGLLAASRSSESEVVTTITTKQDGTASGSFELPEYVEQGNHWLRFRVSGAPGVTAQEGNAADYTNKSPYFTVSGVTVIGGAAPPTVPPAPTPPPHQVAPTGGSKGTGASGIHGGRPGGTGRLPDHRHLNPRPQCDSRGAVGARRGQPSADGCLPASSGCGLTPGLRLGAHLYLRYSVAPGCIRIVA